MSDIGYLQTKIRENKIEAENLKETTFELQRRTNLLEKSITEEKERTLKLQNELEEKMKEIDPKQIKKAYVQFPMRL